MQRDLDTIGEWLLCVNFGVGRYLGASTHLFEYVCGRELGQQVEMDELNVTHIVT